MAAVTLDVYTLYRASLSCSQLMNYLLSLFPFMYPALPCLLRAFYFTFYLHRLGKEIVGIEEYSFSQTTLEQVKRPKDLLLVRVCL